MKTKTSLAFIFLVVYGPVSLPTALLSEEKPLVSPEALNAVAAPSTSQVGAGVPSSNSAPGGNPEDFSGKTVLDAPGANDPRLMVPVDEEGKVSVLSLSKIDLDADLDYDGTFNNEAPAVQGIHEFVPPGLVVGVGEVTRLLIRFKTYEENFPGDLVVSLEVIGVNRDSPSGDFVNAGQESVGRIRVWRDQARKELLLDSGDASKNRFEWRYDKEKLSGGIPRTVYLEGVDVSPEFDGDLRLMVVSNHVAEGTDPATPSSLYRSAFDHLLVTVRKEPVEKEFINNNVEGVWSNVGQTPVKGAAATDGPASGVVPSAQ